MGIVAKIINKIAPAHIEHRAGGNDGAEAHLLAPAPVQNRGLQRAALAQKRDAPFMRHRICEGRIQPDRRVHESHAVRPQQAQRTSSQMSLNFFFQMSAQISLLAKSGGDHDRRFHARVHALADQLRHGLRRRDNHRQVHAPANLADALDGFYSQHFLMAGIDGVQFDRGLALQQIGEHAAAHGSGSIGGADHSGRSRNEKRFQPRPRWTGQRLRNGGER